MNHPFQFSSSDMWLLQAIGMAGQTTPASLRDIIAVGDYINHAIFTWEEFQTGLSKLLSAGLIEIQGKDIALNREFASEYDRLTKGEKLKFYLQQLSITPIENLAKLPLTKTDFETAVRDYQQASG